MSQLFDYFVCDRPTIERWADALEKEDEKLQHEIQSAMSRFVTLRNLGPVEFNIIAQCIEGNDVDVVDAVGQEDLVKAISEEEGPWLTAFRRPAVEAIAGLRVDTPLVQRWVEAVAEFNGMSEDRCREILTADAAKILKDVCSVAVQRRLGVFTCSYG